MANKSYSEWLKNTVRDPLWWTWIISIAVVVVVLILDLVGVIDRDVEPFCDVANVSWAVFGTTLILASVRGKDVGADQPMSTGVRVFTAALGIIVLVVAIVFGIILQP